jgi:hypothetical protein
MPLLLYAIILVIIASLVSVCISEIIRYFKIKSKNDHHTRVEALLTTPLNIDANHLRAQITANIIELNRQLTRNFYPKVTIPKIAIIELLCFTRWTAGLFCVLYYENVTGVRVLEWYQVLTLIDIGLASGNLKEL